MRNLKQIMLFVMMGSLLTLTSCSKDDDGGDSNGGDEFLTAKIDGADYAASQDPVIVGAQSTNGVLAVQGGDSSGNTISITIPNYTGVGTYKTGDNLSNQNGIMYLKVSPTLSTWASNFATAALGTLPAGSINVTSDDGTTVEGTFSFEGYNAEDMTKIVVTEGKFKALFD